MRTTVKNLIVASLLLSIALLGGEWAYAASLYFPHVDTNLPWQTEIAIINDGDQAVTGTLRALSNEGQNVGNPKSVALTAHGRRQIAVVNEFTNHTSIGYIVFESDSSTVQGYTKFYQEGKYRVAIPAVKYVNTGNIYITHIDSSAQWWTGISLVNTTASVKTVTITFSDGQTKQVTIPAYGHRAFSIRSLFDNQAQPGIKSGVISNASGIIGLELFGSFLGGDELEGILLTDKTASTLYYPYVVGGGWWTGIVAYNPSSAVCRITITAYNSQGTVLSTITRDLAGKEKYVGTATQLGFPSGTSWFKIDSTTPITGFELIGSNDFEELAAYVDTGGTGARAGVFPKIEKNGWTTITLVNTENETAAVTLTGYDDAGSTILSQAISIPGHGKFVGSVNETNSTYIAYSSARNMVVSQLNGSTDGTMLDGLPGLTDQDGSTGPPSTSTVDLAQGGVISTSSGVTVTVFKGSGAGEITVSATGSGSAGAIDQQGYVASLEYAISIQGLDRAVLTAPLQVTIPVDLSRLTSTNVIKHVFSLETYDESARTWVPVHSSFEPEYDSAAQTVAFLLTDISRFQAAASANSQMDMDPLPASRYRVRDTLETWGPVPETVVMDEERYVLKVYEGASHFSITYYTSTSTVRPKHAIPNDWQSERGASYNNPLVPDYIEDLGAALEDAYAFYISNVTRSDGSNLFNPISGKTVVEVIDFKGDATGDYDFIKEKIRVKPNLKDWTELRTTAAHELAHRMCDQHYTKGGAFANLWFFEAAANLYAARGCNLDSASTLAYYGEATGREYIGGPINSPEEASMYSVAHFLAWLEKTDSKAYVADVVHASAISDLSQLNSATGNTLGEKLATYVREAVLSDKKWGKISIQESALIKLPSRSSRIAVRQPPLSARLIAVKTDVKADCLLVAPTGAGVAQNSVATYSYADDTTLPVSDTEAWLEKNTPAGKPIVVTHFGAVNTSGVTSNTFYQLVVNERLDYDRGPEGEYIQNSIDFDYYLLVPPTVTQVGEGAVVWSAEGQQGIPAEYFTSDVYDVYDAKGTKLNSNPIGLARDYFVDSRIRFGDNITVVVKDKFGNVWPEPPVADTGMRACVADTAFPGNEPSTIHDCSFDDGLNQPYSWNTVPGTANSATGSSGTAAWPGREYFTSSGTVGKSGCTQTITYVSACPTTALVGICRHSFTSTDWGVPVRSDSATYYYSPAYTAATARTACMATAGSGRGVTAAATWYTIP